VAIILKLLALEQPVIADAACDYTREVVDTLSGKQDMQADRRPLILNRQSET